MKRIALLLLTATLFAAPVVAQQPKVETSAAFDEPENGWNKVLQLKNGNTFFFHFTKKNGIEITVYNKERKAISQKTVTSELWEQARMKESVVEGLYEIGGQPVIFLQQIIDRKPSLFRIKLDPNTGEMAGEKLISSLPKYKAGAKWAMTYGKVEAEDFFVEKDPASDCYAVVNFNSFASESDERIEVIHYNGAEGKHKIVNRAFYDSPNGSFKYLRFIGMSVDAEKSVFLATYGFNSKNNPGKDSRVILSKLPAGSKSFTHNMLEFSDDFRETIGSLQYNPGTNMLQLMTLTYLKTKNGFFSAGASYYMTLLTYIDPSGLSVISTKPFLAEKVSEDMHRQVEKMDGFHGIPQQMVINKDNTTTVLMEEMLKQETIDARTNAVISATTTLGSIGVAELNDRGQENDGHAIIKLQTCKGLFDPMYLSQKSKGKWSYRAGYSFDNNAFLSFDYVNTENNRYILFNDYPSNFNKEEGKRKRKPVTTISGSNTVCYRMKGGSPDKFYLFGTPADDDQTKFCYVESSNFLPESNTYATLMMEKNGRDKQARIAWVTFQ